MSARRDGCPDNLLARSGRGPLTLVEQRALDAHLGVCGSCRATLALRNLFDQIPDSPLNDDRAVVARLAERVTLPGRQGREKARPVAFAAGAALMALAGAAAAWAVLQHPRAVTKLDETSRPGTGTAPAPQVAALPLSPASPSPVAPLPAPKLAASKRAEVHRARAAVADAREAVVGDSPGAAGPSNDAGELFAAANAARGSGDLRGAARRYDLLERRYPTSPEAAVSLVSAGDLFIRLDEPSAALEHFDRYLATNARGSLALEALFGRARSLRDLGRSRDEREAWRELLQRFPGSLYESTARRRVDELSR